MLRRVRSPDPASPSITDTLLEFVVDGTKIPEVNVCVEKVPGSKHELTVVQFDVGESYAGLIPVSSKANETRELFFWSVSLAPPKHSLTNTCYQVLSLPKSCRYRRDCHLVRKHVPYISSSMTEPSS